MTFQSRTITPTPPPPPAAQRGHSAAQADDQTISPCLMGFHYIHNAIGHHRDRGQCQHR